MSLNDEVCTSDPDELESLFATKPNYWRTKPPLSSSSQIADNTSILLTQKPIPSSQPLDDSPRPRKRLKVSPTGVDAWQVGKVNSVLAPRDAVNFHSASTGQLVCFPPALTIANV